MEQESKKINKFKDKLAKLIESKGFKSFMSSLVAIILGILIGFIILLISNPQNSLKGLGRLLSSPFRNIRGPRTGIGTVLYVATPILFTGLAVGFAFKTGVFNIGASGQYMMGLFGAVVVGLGGSFLGPFQWIVAILVGALSGALWGFLSGLLRAFFNVNVVISGIMLNYIAVFFINGMVAGPFRKFMFDGATNRIGKVPAELRTTYAFLDKLFPQSGADLGIIVGIVIAIVLSIILSKTVFGKELKSVGFNRHAAKYAGVNEKFSIAISMAISGFLAGLGGAFYILAKGNRGLGNDYSLEATVLPAGFDGIAVALLGGNHPVGIIFSALFISYIKLAGMPLQSLNYAKELSDVVVAVILYFSAFSLILGQYLNKLFKRRKTLDEEDPDDDSIVNLGEGPNDEVFINLEEEVTEEWV